MEVQLAEVPHEHPAALIAAPTIGIIKLRNLMSTFYAVGLTRRRGDFFSSLLEPLDTIAAGWGYVSVARLAAEAPDLIARTPKEPVAAVLGISTLQRTDT